MTSLNQRIEDLAVSVADEIDEDRVRITALENGFRPVINVTDPIYGAVGDGVTDDTAAIQAAITATQSISGGAIVFFPSGIYNITSALDLTGMFGVTLQGSGFNSTQLKPQTLNQDVLIITNADSITVENLAISYSILCTVACAAVYIGASCRNIFLSKLWIAAAWFGVQCEGDSQLIWMNKLEILDCTPGSGSGVGIQIDGGNEHFLDEIFIQGIVSAQPAAGIRLLNSSGTYITNCSVINTQHGLHLRPNTDQIVENLFAMNNAWDSGTGHGILFETFGTGIIRRCNITADWAATFEGSGVLFLGFCQEVCLTDMRLLNNGDYGLHIGHIQASGVRLRNSVVSGNSRISTGTYPGIRIIAGVSDFSIQNNRIGLTAGLTYQHNQGIYVTAGASNNYQITGNNLLGNNGVGLFDGGTGTNKFIKDNLGSDINVQPVPAVNVANDAAAAAAGVQVGGTYRNGSVLMVRVV